MNKYDYSRQKHVFPPMEEVSVGVAYALTLNIDHKTDTMPVLVRKYCKWLNMITHLCEVSLYPELSKMGKLHYHGTISFKSILDIAEFYLNVPKFVEQGTVAMKVYFKTEEDDPKLTPEEVWTNYMLKQKVYMDALCRKWKVPYHLTNARVEKAVGPYTL